MPNPPDTGSKDNSTGTLGKAISLLEMVVMAQEPPRFTDLLKQSGQPRGTLHRQLSHLVEEGLLEQNSDQSYSAGIRLLKFAAKAWSGSDLRTVAAPHLRDLHEKTGESVHLGVVRGSEIIYLDKIDGKHAVRMYSQIGRTSPLYCTGVGKAALSLFAQDELLKTIKALSLTSFTPNTMTSEVALLENIQTIRERGYGFDLEEHEQGIQCIAVPIETNRPGLYAAISVTGPAYRLTRERLEGWAPLVKDIARRISNDAALRLAPSP
ncbi:IclR family acetate operon transcriptional repressor [Agrobacterium larrymoorei]|uniref:IclR family acetate operon transcriptional repressor n=1 Tax=Agrobacterium larrymoorei TaxID=160699 RepID=A0AAJ2BDD9_9HYPH|nr:IclR family transcriptional regulator [Agrobacterium larrymoorei]MDR6104371.1 IclR family acetate operon transcriptional repressor [Agrobacterium larrymoorei]